MNLYLIVLIGLIIIAVIVVIVWLAYSVSNAYEQTVTVSVPFNETYRYIPHLNSEKLFKITNIKISVAGSLKKDITSGSTISLGSQIKNIVNDSIIIPYNQSILLHETNTFSVQDNMLKRISLPKYPTLENLSVIFFKKLSPLMPKIGCRLVSVKLITDDINVTHSRHKISDYTV